MVSVHTSPAAAPGSEDAGGMNVYIASAARALGAQGHRVDVVTRHERVDTPLQTQDAPGVRVFHLPVGDPALVAKSRAGELIEPFRDELSRWWGEYGQGVDLVHSHHWFAGVAALPVARAAGVAHLQSYHSVAAPVGADLSTGEQPESAERPLGEESAARSSDRIVAVSEAEKRTIIDRFGTDPARVSVVLPGVDTDLFRPAGPADRGHYGAPRGDQRAGELFAAGPFLAFGARLQPLKAPDLAIAALAELSALPHLSLIIAGAVSADFADYEATLRAQVRDLGLGDRVLFVGPLGHERLADLLRQASVLVNPSHHETFSMVNLEASASGTPVVASRSGGMDESVLDGRSGVLLDSRDPRDWAAAIERIITTPGLAARLGAAGRTHAMTRRWSVVADELGQVYRLEVAL